MNTDSETQSSVIQVSDSEAIKLIYPTVGNFINLVCGYIADPKSKPITIEDFYTYSCIDMVTTQIDGDDRLFKLGYDGLDDQFTIDQLIKYLDDLPVSTKIVEKVNTFIDSLPYLLYERSNIRCGACNALSEIKLIGIESFF
jgi:hypothetical protein